MKNEPAPPSGWHATSDARLAPLDARRLPPPMRAVLWAAGKWAEKRNGSDQVPDVFLLLMRHPKLFRPWLRFAAALMPYGTLDRRDTELVILRVGWNCRCRYEWGQHVLVGKRAQLTDAEIARVGEGPDAPGWTALQSAILQAADELHRDRVVSRATWGRLGEHLDTAQLIELCMLVGHYEMLAGLINSVGLPLESRTEELLGAALRASR